MGRTELVAKDPQHAQRRSSGVWPHRHRWRGWGGCDLVSEGPRGRRDGPSVPDHLGDELLAQDPAVAAEGQQEHLLGEEPEVDTGVTLAQDERHDSGEELAREAALLSDLQRCDVGLNHLTGGPQCRGLTVRVGQRSARCVEIHRRFSQMLNSGRRHFFWGSL